MDRGCNIPWYFDPSIHGILNPLPMVYQTTYPWYIEPSTHGMLIPHPWYIEPPAYFLIRNEGVQNTIGVQFTIQGGVQFSIRGVKIPYDTGIYGRTKFIKI
jgi:hypothetical protein